MFYLLEDLSEEHAVALSDIEKDLLENPKTGNHILNWRGKDGGAASCILYQTWLQENIDTKAKKIPQDVFLDIS